LRKTTGKLHSKFAFIQVIYKFYMYIEKELKSYSIFDEGEFADESFKVKHTESGLLGMCKKNGLANSNEC